MDNTSATTGPAKTYNDLAALPSRPLNGFPIVCLLLATSAICIFGMMFGVPNNPSLADPAWLTMIAMGFAGISGVSVYCDTFDRRSHIDKALDNAFRRKAVVTAAGASGTSLGVEGAGHVLVAFKNGTKQWYMVEDLEWSPNPQEPFTSQQ